MPPINKSLIQKLKALLPYLHIVTPDSPDYGKSIQRKRTNTENPAVRYLYAPLYHKSITYRANMQ